MTRATAARVCSVFGRGQTGHHRSIACRIAARGQGRVPGIIPNLALASRRSPLRRRHPTRDTTVPVDPASTANLVDAELRRSLTAEHLMAMPAVRRSPWTLEEVDRLADARP